MDRRKEKRYDTKMVGGHAAEACYVAYVNGCDVGYYKRNTNNPYPPGKRHNAFERGRNIASEK